MIPPEEDGVGIRELELEDGLDHPPRVGPPVDVVPDEDDFVVFLKGDLLDQQGQHSGLTVDITDGVEVRQRMNSLGVRGGLVRNAPGGGSKTIVCARVTLTQLSEFLVVGQFQPGFPR